MVLGFIDLNDCPFQLKAASLRRLRAAAAHSKNRAQGHQAKSAARRFS
jgi:hypothetical protein